MKCRIGHLVTFFCRELNQNLDGKIIGIREYPSGVKYHVNDTSNKAWMVDEADILKKNYMWGD